MREVFDLEGDGLMRESKKWYGLDSGLEFRDDAEACKLSV